MARRVGIVVALVVAAAALAFGLLSPPSTQDPSPGPEGERPGRSAHEEEGASRGQPDAEPVLQGARDAQPAADRPARSAAEQTAGTLFVGKVVDVQGGPATGARVELVAEEGVVATAEADDEGAFGLRFVVTDAMKVRPALVRARGTDATVGQVPLYLAPRAAPGVPPAEAEVPGRREVGTIRLGPSNAFDVRVLSACERGLPATLWLVSTTFGLSSPWIVTETDAEGAATLRGVPQGNWMLVASARDCGRARTFVKLPRETSEPVELELPPAHVLTVRVRDAADGAPIVGAVVRVTEQLRMPQYYRSGPLVSMPSSYLTDAQGVARIDGLGGGEALTLSAEAEGYPKGSEHSRRGGRGPGQARVEPGATEVVIELHQPLTVRWPIKNEGIGVPADGTELAIEPWTNTGRLTVPPTGMVENGQVVVGGWGPDGASGYAVVAGRGIARLSAQAGEREGWPTAFYPLRSVEVVVRHADGTPAEGWFLSVRDGGGNAVKPGVATNAEGHAVLEGLYGGPGALVNVSVADKQEWGGFSMPLGSVNLGAEDGRFEAEIPRERSFTIRVTIEGRTMPDGFAGRPTLNRMPLPRAETGAEDETSPDPGLFVARWRPVKPDAKAYVSAVAAGYLAETKVIAAADLSDATEIVVDLRPAGGVKLKVTEPEDKRYQVTVQRWNEEDETWGQGHLAGGFSAGSGRRADANGLVEYRNLEPGRYRAVETRSGLTSEPFEVPAGGDAVEVPFDVSSTGWVKGRVVLPEGFPFEGVSVGPVGAAPEDYQRWTAGAAALPGRAVNREDGTFWLRVPGDRPITIRLYHAMLRPHPTKGRVTVTKPQEGVELHAMRGATATVRFQSAAVVRMNRGRARPISVRLYAGAVEGEGVSLSGVLDAAHRKVEFGGYEPGTYTVWIDAPGRAPVVLKDVALGPEATDLGEVALEEGASLELGVTVKEGQSPPRFSVWVRKLDEPTYVRHIDGAGERLTVSGIGAGRFQVSASAYNGAAPGINEEIEFDGRTKVVRTIDVR